MKSMETINTNKVEANEAKENPNYSGNNNKAPEKDFNTIVSDISKQEETIVQITGRVTEIRRSLGVSEDGPIPSVDACKQKIDAMENNEVFVKQKFLETLNLDVSKKYENTIDQIRQEKINWAKSKELVRRLKLKGAEDDDVKQVQEWLINNANQASVIVLKPNDFSDAAKCLIKMTGENNLVEGSAFYAGDNFDNIPDQAKNSIFIQEKPAPPPLPGKQQETVKEKINETELNHEFGHATQDGLLTSELYADWNPKFKEGATDPEYVGKIHETDTRICSMFREAKEFFNPHKETFDQKHLDQLKKMLKEYKLSKDVTDLFNNYDDAEIIKHANELPAI